MKMHFWQNYLFGYQQNGENNFNEEQCEVSNSPYQLGLSSIFSLILVIPIILMPVVFVRGSFYFCLIVFP